MIYKVPSLIKSWKKAEICTHLASTVFAKSPHQSLSRKTHQLISFRTSNTASQRANQVILRPIKKSLIHAGSLGLHSVISTLMYALDMCWCLVIKYAALFHMHHFVCIGIWIIFCRRYLYKQWAFNLTVRFHSYHVL